MAELPRDQYEVVCDELRETRKFVRSRLEIAEPIGGIHQDVEGQLMKIFEDDKEAFTLETWPARMLVDLVVEKLSDVSEEEFERFLNWFGLWIHEEFRTGRPPQSRV